jgi:hypothetical protein
VGEVRPGLPTAVAADPAAIRYVDFIGHWESTGTLGFDLFGLLTALTTFRRGERWAWLALSIGALAATYRKVWTTSRAADRAVAVSR